MPKRKFDNRRRLEDARVPGPPSEDTAFPEKPARRGVAAASSSSSATRTAAIDTAAIDATKKRASRSRDRSGAVLVVPCVFQSLSLSLASYIPLVLSLALTCVVLVHLLVRRHSPASPLLGTGDDDDDETRARQSRSRHSGNNKTMINETTTLRVRCWRFRSATATATTTRLSSILPSPHLCSPHRLSHGRVETARKCNINTVTTTLSRSVRSSSGVPSLGYVCTPSHHLVHDVYVYINVYDERYRYSATLLFRVFHHHRAIRRFPSFRPCCHSPRRSRAKPLLLSLSFPPFPSCVVVVSLHGFARERRERLSSTKHGFSSVLSLPLSFS